MKQVFLVLCAITLLAFSARAYNVTSNPPGLYWDEIAFGLDASSILQTGRDHHGRFLPIFFESFGDWKLPGYFYLLIPSIAIFGNTELAVRLPSILLGSLTPLMLYLLLRKLLNNQYIPLITGLMLAISPWHIQFSRAGFESTPALFFVVAGLYLLVLSFQKPKLLTLLGSFLLLCASMYTYHAYRIFTPILLVTTLVIFRDKVIKQSINFVIVAAISAVVLFPLITFSFSSEGRARATSQSAFNKQEVESAKIDFDQRSKPPLRFLSGRIFKQPVYYSQVALKGYLDHFSPTFLFTKGDQIGRHSQVDMGQIFLFDTVLLLSAVLFIPGLLKEKIIPKKVFLLMLIWLFASPLAASIVTPTPHAYRSFSMVIALSFFSALGAYGLLNLKRSKKAVLAALLAFAILVFINYLHLLFVHYPKKYAADWQAGQKQLVQAVQSYEDNYEKIYVTTTGEPTYAYFRFFGKYSAEEFKKFSFVDRDFLDFSRPKVLYVAPSWKEVNGYELTKVNVLTTGEYIYSLWEMTK